MSENEELIQSETEILRAVVNTLDSSQMVFQMTREIMESKEEYSNEGRSKIKSREEGDK